MPSAKSSDRTTRFMKETLGIGPNTIQHHLSNVRVRIQLDPIISDNFVGQAIMFTLLNLLVRLDDYCPELEVSVPDVSRHPLLRLLSPVDLRSALEDFFAPFPAAGRIAFRNELVNRDADLNILVSPNPSLGKLSIWADGWIIYLNEHAGCGPWDPNIIGSSTAAGLIAAEAFKRMLLTIPVRYELPIYPVERLIFSTWDYGLVVGDNPPLPETINVNGVVIVGLGGIGAALVAAASSLPRLSGTLTLVDKDDIDDTNLNRFLVARHGETGTKVDLCRRALDFHAYVETRYEWFDEFISKVGDQHALVIVGVDKDKVRRQIQATLPRVILNGGTSDTASFRVSRHDFIHGACLSCISQDDLTDSQMERGLSRILGLDPEVVTTYAKLGQPIPAAALRKSGVLMESDIERLGNQQVEEIQNRVCTQVPLLAEDQGDEAVSISFLSALPGFLLLGELVKERGYPHEPPPALNNKVNSLLLSVLGKPHPKLLRGWFEKRNGCDCTRSAYQSAFHRKWPVAPLLPSRPIGRQR